MGQKLELVPITEAINGDQSTIRALIERYQSDAVIYAPFFQELIIGLNTISYKPKENVFGGIHPVLLNNQGKIPVYKAKWFTSNYPDFLRLSENHLRALFYQESYKVQNITNKELQAKPFVFVNDKPVDCLAFQGVYSETDGTIQGGFVVERDKLYIDKHCLIGAKSDETKETDKRAQIVSKELNHDPLSVPQYYSQKRSTDQGEFAMTLIKSAFTSEELKTQDSATNAVLQKRLVGKVVEPYGVVTFDKGTKKYTSESMPQGVTEKTVRNKIKKLREGSGS